MASTRDHFEVRTNREPLKKMVMGVFFLAESGGVLVGWLVGW